MRELARIKIEKYRGRALNAIPYSTDFLKMSINKVTISELKKEYIYIYIFFLKKSINDDLEVGRDISLHQIEIFNKIKFLEHNFYW